MSHLVLPPRTTAWLALVLIGLAACQPIPTRTFQGYVEGDFVYLATPQSGYLKTLDAHRGTHVKIGDTVFTLASDPDRQALDEAQARAASAQDTVVNLQNARRNPEIASLQAQLQAAQAQQNLAYIKWQTQEKLVAEHFVAPLKRDEARSAYDQANAQVLSLQEQIRVAQSPVGRDAEIRAAQSAALATQANANVKRWALNSKVGISPDEGDISDTYYRPGEWVPAGAPVASVLPDNRKRLRFFVAETQIATLRLGQAVQAQCDGCQTPIQGVIDFIAPQAEYTPPVIYSKGNREKLVFRVEASVTTELARQLRPGLPIDVQTTQP